MVNEVFKAVRLNARTYPLIPDEENELRKVGAELVCIEGSSVCEILEVARDADALLVVSAKVPKEVIQQLYKCRVIARYGTGIDNIDVEAATANGIVVTNVPDFCIGEMADHTMALLLAIARKILVLDRRTRNCEWNARIDEHLRRISGRVLGLVGFGRIARAVARRAKPFDFIIYAYDPYVAVADAEEYGVRLVSLEELLEKSDFVSLHLPLTPNTWHLIGEAQLRSMKPTAILINTARGAIVDENALVRALSEKWISGAALDVYENLNVFEEKCSIVTHPLLRLENVILTPHCGGCSDESLIEVKRKAIHDVIMVLSGRWPKNCVNPGVVPRWPLAW